MIFWIIAALLTVGAVAMLVSALVRPGRSHPVGDGDSELQIYRDQLAEVDGDLERGVLGERDAVAVRREAARRLLERAGQTATAAASEPASGPAPAPVGKGTRFLALGLCVIVPTAAIAVYLWRGSPELPGMPLAGRDQVPIETLVERVDLPIIVERLFQAPTAEARLELTVALAQALTRLPEPDPDGWLIVGREFLAAGRIEEGLLALGVAHRAADEGRADIAATLGAALVWSQSGVVTPQARAILTTAMALDPSRAEVKLLLGDAHLQAGEREEALALWRGLVADAPAQAPWLPAVRERIAAVEGAAVEEATVAGPRRPDVAMQDSAPTGDAQAEGPPLPEGAAALAALPPQARSEAVRGMVEGLEARLRDDPNNPEGWLMLARSFQVLGEDARARAALSEAAAHLPDDRDILAAYAGSLTDSDGLGDEAVAVYLRILEIDPDDPEALWRLAAHAVRTGDESAARDRLQHLLSVLGPDSPQRPAAEALYDQLPP